MGFFSDRQTKKKITILLGHPDRGATLSSDFADTYEAAAKKAGHTVQRFNLAELTFDPILHKGYKEIQELEPDLKRLQEAITWCDHFVIVYPTWWGTMPALFKGLFDRMWLPGFCFGFYKSGMAAHYHLWKRYMKGKTARVFVLSGSQPFLIWLFFGDYTNEIGRGILWFVGFKVRLSRMGPTDHNPPQWLIDGWRKKVAKLAALAE